MLLIALVAVFFVGGTIVMLKALHSAPEGVEDENGFYELNRSAENSIGGEQSSVSKEGAQFRRLVPAFHSVR